MSTPAVSVIVPIFNGGRYLDAALRSVLEQTFRDLELLCVDNGSTDDSAAIVQRLAASDARITLRHHATRGQCAARNAGAAHAAGRYLAFLDQDDLWYPHKLAQEVPVLETEPEVVMVHSNLDLVDQDGVLFRRASTTQYRRDGSHETMARLLGMELCFIMPSSILLRRRAFEAIGGFDEGMIRLEDYDFFWRLSAHGRVRLLETSGAMYRVHPGNFTLSVGPKSFNGDEGYRSMERFYRKLEHAYADDPAKAPLVRELLAGCYAGWGKYKMQSGETLAGRALLRDALRRHWTLKSAWRLVRSYLPAVRPLQQRSGTC